MTQFCAAMSKDVFCRAVCLRFGVVVCLQFMHLDTLVIYLILILSLSSPFRQYEKKTPKTKRLCSKTRITTFAFSNASFSFVLIVQMPCIIVLINRIWKNLDSSFIHFFLCYWWRTSNLSNYFQNEHYSSKQSTNKHSQPSYRIIRWQKRW